MRLACDTGGTFTDLVVERGDEIRQFKSSTVPADPVQGDAACAGQAVRLDQLLDPWGRRFELIVPGPNGHPFEVVSLGAS